MKHTNTALRAGFSLLFLFLIWTILIQTVDVHPAGETAKTVGFSTLNAWFHGLTGTHMMLYRITDWLGLIPALICILFGMIGLHQLITRKSLFKVDLDLILLGIYYILVIIFYFIFEMFPINYRPVFIEGRLEASYPSSTTLLVLSVMPTLSFRARYKLKRISLQKAIRIFAAVFSLFTVIGRTLSGVHWITDIIGAVLFSAGLFSVYKAAAMRIFSKEHRREVML